MWEFPLAALPEDDLVSAFRSGKVEAMWRFTKKNVLVCKNCEYRFSCSDCSILEWALSEDQSLHKVFCSYIPERGEGLKSRRIFMQMISVEGLVKNI